MIIHPSIFRPARCYPIGIKDRFHYRSIFPGHDIQISILTIRTMPKQVITMPEQALSHYWYLFTICNDMVDGLSLRSWQVPAQGA